MAAMEVGAEVAGYRIEEIAGRGGMGVVYRARQVALDRPVALKAIAPEWSEDEDFRARFRHESRLAAAIEHPNVIPVYEAGEWDGQLYLVMRWVEGTDLREVLEREGVVQPARATQLVAQVAAALAAAHRGGLVHRDVKPANVLLTRDEEHEHAYLTDFGIARNQAATTGLTKTGSVVGTVDYLAPERLLGERGDGRSDIYACGCMLFEVLTGAPPYPRDTDVAKMWAHMNDPVPSALAARPELPLALDEVVRRAMAKAPEERFQQAADLGRALASAGAGPVDAAGETGGARADGAEAEATAMTPPDAEPALPPTERAGAPGPSPSEASAQPTAPAEGAAPPRPTAPAPPEEPTAPARPPLGSSAQPAAGPARARAARRRGLVAAGAGGLAAVVALAVVLAIPAGDEDSGLERQDVRSPAATRAVAGEPIRVGRSPDGAGFGEGAAWVALAGEDAVARIDARSRRVAGEPVRVGDNPDSVAVGEGGVWVTNTGDGTVTRIDPASGEADPRPIEVGGGPEGIAVGAGAIWVANAPEGQLTRIEPRGGRVSRQASAGRAPFGVAVAEGAVWVANKGDDTVSRLDAASGRPLGSAIRVGNAPHAVAVSAGIVWVSNSEDGTVSRLDARSGRLAGRPIPVGENPRDMAARAGQVWVSNTGDGTVTRIDARTGRVLGAPIEVGDKPVGIAAGPVGAWAANLADGTVTPIALR
jgi:DNA-binding beta-propeller fold protein YncE